MKRIDCITKRTKNPWRGSVRTVWLLAAALAVVGLGIILQSHRVSAAPLFEWSNDARDVTPSGRVFLGQFSNQTVSLLLPELPAHSQVTVSFDLFIIGGGWNGNYVGYGDVIPDLWDLSVANGPTLLHTTFSNYESISQAYPDTFPGGENYAWTGASEGDTLGYPRPWSWDHCADCTCYLCHTDSVYHLSFSFPHSLSALQLNFSATENGGSWGLDNVEVAVNGNVVYSNDFESSISGVPFETFNAEATAKGPQWDNQTFELNAKFITGADSNGIDPLNEAVSLRVGAFSTTVPAGSFRADNRHRGFRFKGVIGGVRLAVEITELKNRGFQFTATGSHANLIGTEIPVRVGIMIGDDNGQMTLNHGLLTTESYPIKPGPSR